MLTTLHNYVNQFTLLQLHQLQHNNNIIYYVGVGSSIRTKPWSTCTFEKLSSAPVKSHYNYTYTMVIAQP